MIDETPRIRRKTKRERFEEIAEKRTNVVLQKLRVLGNCANRASYEYSDAHVEKIFDAIEEQVRTVKARFVEKRKVRFTL